jgi:hypothetical protein
MLASFAQAFAEGFDPEPRDEPAVARSSSKPPAPLPVTMQLCLPAAEWDWPTDPNGSVSAPLYEFVSYVPQRADAWGAYAATTIRVSDGYSQFLAALEAGPQVTSALAALAAPANQTQVLFPNGPALMPTWTVPESPQGFVASVVGKPGLAATIVVDLSRSDDTAPSGQALFAVGTGGAADTPVQLGGGEVKRIELHADAWGNVPVRPGPWFQGALVGLFANGPFRGGLPRDAFFGTTGILRGMMTGLRVGLNVSVVATMSDDAAARVETAARDEQAIRVAGFMYDAAALTSRDIDGVRQLSLPSSAAIRATGQPIGAGTPVLVGVDVEALG